MNFTPIGKWDYNTYMEHYHPYRNIPIPPTIDEKENQEAKIQATISIINEHTMGTNSPSTPSVASSDKTAIRGLKNE